MPDSQSSEPGFDHLCYLFEGWAFSLSPRRPSSRSGINEFVAIDSGGNVSETFLCSNCSMAECFPEKLIWCWNEHVKHVCTHVRIF